MKQPKPKALWVQIRDRNKRAVRERPRRISPVSAVRKLRLAEYAKAKRQFLRGRECLRCGKARGKCDIHHTRGRVGPLLTESKWWVALCRNCHEWVGRNPAEARAEGLLCEAGKWNSIA